MVALHKRYHQRVPVTAKTLLLDGEILVCMLGVYTDVEKTLIEIQPARPSRKPAAHSRLQCNINSSLPSNAYRAATCSRSSQITTSAGTWKSSSSYSSRAS